MTPSKEWFSIYFEPLWVKTYLKPSSGLKFISELRVYSFEYLHSIKYFFFETQLNKKKMDKSNLITNPVNKTGDQTSGIDLAIKA